MAQRISDLRSGQAEHRALDRGVQSRPSASRTPGQNAARIPCSVLCPNPYFKHGPRCLVLRGALHVALLLLHLAVIAVLGIGFGGIIVWRFSRLHICFRVTFFSLVLAVFLSDYLFHACILTLAERYCWESAKVGNAYRGTFLGHYIPRLSNFVDRDALLLMKVGALIPLLMWLYESSLTKIRSHVRRDMFS
jgi:hypothetical protein